MHLDHWHRSHELLHALRLGREGYDFYAGHGDSNNDDDDDDDDGEHDVDVDVDGAL